MVQNFWWVERKEYPLENSHAIKTRSCACPCEEYWRTHMQTHRAIAIIKNKKPSHAPIIFY